MKKVYSAKELRKWLEGEAKQGESVMFIERADFTNPEKRKVFTKPKDVCDTCGHERKEHYGQGESNYNVPTNCKFGWCSCEKFKPKDVCEHQHIKPNCKLCHSMWKAGYDDGYKDRLDVENAFPKDTCVSDKGMQEVADA